MSWETMALLLAYAGRQQVRALDLTGGAPELNPGFRRLVTEARAMGLRVIDRCNLTILNEPGQKTLARFLAEQGVEITASLPCYLEENVDRQRGDGVFESSLGGLRKLNALGYGRPDSGRVLSLVYNPLGPSLPPDQAALEAAYTEQLASRYGIVFNTLFALANMPINRFGSQLVSRSFMSITILVMINPLLSSTSEFLRQAHSSLEIRPAFRLIPHWIRLSLAEDRQGLYNRALSLAPPVTHAGGL